jgi:SNF2 family DNA or RNA helicase
MLSGTIMPNQPVEVYNACRLLDWDSIDQMSLNSFRKHYYAMGSGFVTIRGKPQWSNNVRNVPVNLEELQQRLRGNFMVRRLKEQVLTQLPPKTWSLFPIQMTGAIKKALSHPGWKVAEKLYELDDNALDSGVPIDGEIATARRELGEAKVPAIIEYIKEKLDEVDKLVVCAWHHSVLDTLKEALAGYGLVYMDGTTSARNRQAAVDQFQDDGRVRIILGQMQTLGEGWTLTAAQDVVVSEPDWVPGKNDQMLDRIHRIGAEDADYVIGHVPVVPGSLDERILSTAIAKDKNIYEALDA